MPKKVLLIGHCGPDSSYLRLAVRTAAPDAAVSMADDAQVLTKALDVGVDLALVNRVLDADLAESSGVELIERLRESYPNVRYMLISNYPEAQAAAVKAGALPGFGKRDIGSSAARAALKNALE